MTDKLVRRFAVCISVLELVVLLGYCLPLVWNVRWFDLEHIDISQYDDNYVSDLLFNDVIYKTSVSILVALQICVCAYFVVQLNQKKEGGCCLCVYFPVMALELFTLCLAWVGWVIVTSVYLDTNGKMTTGHILGAGLFISACGVYFILIMGNVFFSYRKKWSVGECFVFVLTILCFIISAVVGCLFVVSFFDHRIQFGWVFEHAAFILFVAAHIWLFIVDGWLEEKNSTGHGVDPPDIQWNPMDWVRIHRRDVSHHHHHANTGTLLSISANHAGMEIRNSNAFNVDFTLS